MFSSSKSQSSDNRQVATDAGVNVREGAYMSTNMTLLASDKAKLATGKAQVTGDNSVTVGEKGTLNTGISLSGVKGNVTIGDGGAAVASVANVFADAVKELSEGSSAAIRSALTAQSQQQAKLAELLSGAFGQVAEVAAGPEAAQTKTVFWIVLALLGLLAVLFSNR